MKIKLITFTLITAAIFIASCKDDDGNEPVGVVQDNTPYMLSYGNFPAPNIATDNQLTQQGVKLGRMLFYEKMLSANGEMACASCHLQEFAFTDTAKFSIGVQGKKGGRQAMSVFNMAWNENEFFLGWTSTPSQRSILRSYSR